MPSKSPKETVKAVENASINKTSLTIDQIMILSFMAGAFIGFGGFLSVTVAGDLPAMDNLGGLKKFISGATFPVGLMMIACTGAELFTGNTMVLVPGLLNRKISLLRFLASLILSWLFNFLGAFCVSVFLSYFPYENPPNWVGYIIAIAERKANYSFHQAFLLGIGANWLVCIAVFIIIQADNVPGKLAGAYFPILTFVVLGFEHSIANMYYFPTAMLWGANVTFGQFLLNLVIVTFGNIIGGSIIMGFLFWYTYSFREGKRDLIENLWKKIYKKETKVVEDKVKTEQKIEEKKSEEKTEEKTQEKAEEKTKEKVEEKIEEKTEEPIEDKKVIIEMKEIPLENEKLETPPDDGNIEKKGSLESTENV